MLVIALATLIGVVAGLRTMMAPTAVSWAASLGWIDLSGTWLSFAGYWLTPWLLTVAAIGELVTDKLPSTPSRKTPPQFAARLVMGGLSGAAIGAAGDMWLGGLVAGVVGALIGTFGGSIMRAKLAASFGRDLPAALLEDAVAIVAAVLIVSAI